MKNLLLLDLVHHNPGEPPFASAYNDPSFLAARGYRGVVYKHLNACVPLGNFPHSEAGQAWLSAATVQREEEIRRAKAADLLVFYHVDLFVLPKSVVEENRRSICDEQGRICIDRPATLELHRTLLTEMFSRYPQVDGLVIRVGETYLYDTPHHIGNTAVPLHDPAISRVEKIRRFQKLVRFLREEVCEKNGRRLIYRTWDYFKDCFHSDREFYLSVTDHVPTHPLLCFSMKHTAGDFFRGCRPNPCIGCGNHPQIVEIQCAREYEGKGAFPNYIARAVIEGFPEVPGRTGLRDWLQTPQFSGIWTWSRGGGWYGPYLKNEFWPDFNARVLGKWAAQPLATEAELFLESAEEFGITGKSAELLRQLCDTAEEMIWFGRSIPVFARLRGFQDADCAELWMRDDCLGGLDQLHAVFRQLHAAQLLDSAVCEKETAARLAARLPEIARCISCESPDVRSAIRTSAHYAARLFALIAFGWKLMVRRWRARVGEPTEPVTPTDVEKFLALKHHFFALSSEFPHECASLYRLEYWNWPGEPLFPGMEASILGE